jgi:O-antigen ligase
MYRIQPIDLWKVKRQLAFKESGTLLYKLASLLLFTMVFRLTFLTRQRVLSEYAVVDAYNLVNIVCTFAIAGILTIKLREVVSVVREGGPAIRCIVYYYLVCAGSGFWSIRPEFSAFRASEFLFAFLMLMILVRRTSGFHKAEQLVLLFINLFLLTMILSRFVAPIGANSNSLSVTGALLLAYSLGEFKFAGRGRKYLLSASLLMGLVCVLTGSSTATNVALLAALFVLLLVSPSHLKYLLLLAPVLLMGQYQDRLFATVTAGKSLDEVVNLHHRAKVWAESLQIFLQRPWLGHGFALAMRHSTSSILHAHSAYLEMLLGVGILGSGVLILGCLAILRDIGSVIRSRKDGSLGCSIAVIVYLINCLAKPGLGYIISVQSVAFALMLSLFIYHVRTPCKQVITTQHGLASNMKIPSLYRGSSV